MNKIELTIGTFYIKNVMIDVDGSNLEEGIDVFDEDKKFIRSIIGFYVEDENIEEIVELNIS